MNINNHTQEDRSFGSSSQARSQKLKEIDELYRAQIKQIYAESKDRIEKSSIEHKYISPQIDKKVSYTKKQSREQPPVLLSASKQLQSAKSASTLNLPDSQSSSKMFISGSESDEKGRASTFLRGESTRTIEILRRENETKELKIRQLTSKCQNLVDKLKKHLSQGQFQAQLQTLRQFSDTKMERLEHLFKIKQEEILFKIKLQAVGLLQEFGVGKEGLLQFNDVAQESQLFALMSRKLKNRLKDFRNKEQESSFQLQRDKILSQKQQQRIHFLTETNQLLKLSQSKLKGKIQDLKHQLNDYLDKLAKREKQNEENDNQIFRLRRQNDELQGVNLKMTAAIKNISVERQDEKMMWAAQQKQMKVLLNNYYVQKKKLQTDLDEKQSELEQLLIKLKFLQQENERINRELVRWKQRYEWLQKEKDTKYKEALEQKDTIARIFEEYKLQNNQSILMEYRAEVAEAMRKVQQYQRAYERAVLQLQDERRLLQRSQEQAEARIQQLQSEWLTRVKRLQKIKQDQLQQMSQDFDTRISQERQAYEKKQQLIAQQMQARLKALLAQKDKKTTAQLIQLQSQNDQLRRQVNDLHRIVEVKQSLINVINSKNTMKP